MKCAGIGVFMFFLGIGLGYTFNKPPLSPPPPIVKTTDQQCIAWLFESNLKDVKKKVCKK